MKGLIVTADDFGAAVEVNEAVEEAHRRGVLTAASLMVSAPAAADAVVRARRMPSLRVGLHLTLTEGRPLLPPSAVSHLVDKSGAFRSDMAGLGSAIYFGSEARRQLAAEITAQFTAFHATGLALDHCNAHQHFHLHPTVGTLLAQIGRGFGLRAVRVPLESRTVLRRIEPLLPSVTALLTAPFALMLSRRLRASGFLVPDQVFGLQWSGKMNQQRLSALVRNLPEGLSEIYVHPAVGSYPGAAPDMAIVRSSKPCCLPTPSPPAATLRCVSAASATSRPPGRRSAWAWCRSAAERKHDLLKIRLVIIAAMVLSVALALYFAMTVGVQSVVSAATAVGWRGFAILCLYGLGLFLILGSAWNALLPDSTPSRLKILIWARMVRDAASEVLPFSHVGGILLGARAAIVHGLPQSLGHFLDDRRCDHGDPGAARLYGPWRGDLELMGLANLSRAIARGCRAGGLGPCGSRLGSALCAASLRDDR